MDGRTTAGLVEAPDVAANETAVAPNQAEAEM